MYWSCYFCKLHQNSSKFQKSVTWSVCEIGLQGCCFVDHVALAVGAQRWDTDRFQWNKAESPSLVSVCCFSLGAIQYVVIE